jgi:hypothetical protein
MSARVALVASIVCVELLAGCGIHDPYRRLNVTASTTAAHATDPVGSPAAHEDDGPRAPAAPDPGPRAGSTPQAALIRFGQLYINWTATALPDRARQLARISIGQARVAALQMVARRRTLVRYRVRNSGSVVAIAAAHGTEQGRWAVITTEVTSGVGPYLGLPATSHVTWATVEHQAGGYVVSTWYPAS